MINFVNLKNNTYFYTETTIEILIDMMTSLNETVHKHYEKKSNITLTENNSFQIDLSYLTVLLPLIPIKVSENLNKVA